MAFLFQVGDSLSVKMNVPKKVGDNERIVVVIHGDVERQLTSVSRSNDLEQINGKLGLEKIRKAMEDTPQLHKYSPDVERLEKELKENTGKMDRYNLAHLAYSVTMLAEAFEAAAMTKNPSDRYLKKLFGNCESFFPGGAFR